MFNKGAIRSDISISFRGKYVFMKLGLLLLIVLKFSIAKVSNLLISIVVIFFVFNKAA